MISGATKKTFVLSFDGDYHVVVTSSEGCSNTSDILNVRNLAIVDTRAALNIRLYPNPAQNIVYIEAPVPLTLQVSDAQGRRIAKLDNAQQVDMSAYSDGMYLFTFLDAEGQVLGTQSIMKRTQ